MAVQFIYFDLGNVLLFFDHRRSARQMAEVAGIPTEAAWELVFRGDLHVKFEKGELSGEQFYAEFCRQTGSRPELTALARAASDIFQVNASIKPVLGQLAGCRFRLGLLSNTNTWHWSWVTGGRFGMMHNTFEQVVLSFQVGAMKPDERIYQVAAERAGVAREEILFIDDMAANVSAAKACGWDAIQYTDAPSLARQLHARGVQFNY